MDASIHYGVGIEEGGTLRMLREKEAITLKIPLEEYLTTLDSLQSNVEDLLEPDTLEEEKAFSLQSGGLTLNVLKGTRDPNATPKIMLNSKYQNANIVRHSTDGLGSQNCPPSDRDFIDPNGQ